uniref:pyridoxal 5'-phosphate synthase n=1 Tax=Arcella intermedia TaxID=1963864 RepID=A0A6B2LI60_9EUKA
MEFDSFQTHPINSEPLVEFGEWYKAARRTPSRWAHNFALATVDEGGGPQSRTVSLHSFDERGFVFCSNYVGPKAVQIESNPKVSMYFTWEGLRRTVRINGTCTKIPRQETEILYNKCRPEEKLYFYSSSQGMDHPFNQSTPYNSHEEFLNYQETMKHSFGIGKYFFITGEEKSIPLPENWGGFRIEPHSIEFLDLSKTKLGRFIYVKQNGTWTKQYLVM